MSGSPVYIQGKLVGAVAYSFPYSKEAIAGITPIEEMLAIVGEKAPQSRFTARITLQKDISLEALSRTFQKNTSSKKCLLTAMKQGRNKT